MLRIERLRSALVGPFDLEIEAGRCLAVMGASGAGKSLFLRMIADLDPHEGEVWLHDRARASMPAHAWRAQAVYVAAESGWWADGVAEHFRRERLDQARALAAGLGLAPAMIEAQVARLSTGERQRLALVRALVLESPVLLLDEPTAALDQASVLQVEALLRARLAAGASLILVTHDPAQAERLGDQRRTLVQGRLEAAA